MQVERRSTVAPLLADLDAPAAVQIDVAFVDPVDRGTDDDPVDIDGWEIGALTVLLPAGVATVTGIDERRVIRVRAVLAALEAAR